MELLRAFLKWVGRHKILSSVFCAGLIGSGIFARVVIVRSDGIVTEPIERGAIVDAVYGIGTITATHSYSIKPGIIATISELYVKEGDAVKKGTLLASIDNVPYRAPFAGVVNFLPFKVGENIFTQLPALVLTNLKDRYLVATLEQQGALRVRAGQTARLSFDSIREKSYDGVVESVYSYNGNFLARIDVSSLPAEILPDMTADVAIILRELKEVLLVPTPAIENGYVWVKHGMSLPSKIPVTLGVVDGTMAQIVSGSINPGDRLIIRKRAGS